MSRAKRYFASRSVCIIALFNLAIADSPVVLSELAQLFWDLEHADVALIMPMTELAKLALVTSKVDGDDIEQNGPPSTCFLRSFSVDGSGRQRIRAHSQITAARHRSLHQSRETKKRSSPIAVGIHSYTQLAVTHVPTRSAVEFATQSHDRLSVT